MEKCIDLVMDIDSGLLDKLSGRYLQAEDDWRMLAQRPQRSSNSTPIASA